MISNVAIKVFAAGLILLSATVSQAGTAVTETQAYFSNYDGNSVSQCMIEPGTGILSRCTEIIGFYSPYSIALGHGYAYVTNYGFDTVSKCKVDSATGGLFECAATGRGFQAPSAIALHQQFVYVSNLGSGTLSKCNIAQTNGGIVIHDHYAYIAGVDLIKCNVHPETGDLSHCISSGYNTTGASGIAIGPEGYAYVTNYNHFVSKCMINAITGELSHCTQTGSGFNNPNGIGIINGYAYIQNYDVSTISRCTIQEKTGELLDCIPTGSGFNGNSGDIAFLSSEPNE